MAPDVNMNLRQTFWMVTDRDFRRPFVVYIGEDQRV